MRIFLGGDFHEKIAKRSMIEGRVAKIETGDLPRLHFCHVVRERGLTIPEPLNFCLSISVNKLTKLRD
jgi:hypothetical protein